MVDKENWGDNKGKWRVYSNKKPLFYSGVTNFDSHLMTVEAHFIALL